MRLTLAILVAIGSTGCTLSFDWLRQIRAERLAAKGDFSEAVRLLKKIRDRNPDGQRALEASRSGARVAQMEAKDYSSAIDFYKHIILKSDQAEERRGAQISVAQIYFEHLQDYNQAVIEYERLLKLQLSTEENFRFRLNLAKSHFQLNNLDQAENELVSLLEKELEPDQKFDVLVVRANIETANKKLASATQTWEEIMKEFPERAKREKVGLNLVVGYEELKDFEKAIAVLESIKADDPNPDFIDLRIQRLKERKINQPGAQGWRR